MTNKFVGLSLSRCCNRLYNRRCWRASAVKGRGRHAQGSVCTVLGIASGVALLLALPGISASAEEPVDACGGVRSIKAIEEIENIVKTCDKESGGPGKTLIVFDILSGAGALTTAKSQASSRR